MKQELYFSYFKAIRRLSHDDIQLIEKMSEILNKVVTKGQEMNKIMSDLEDFRKKAEKSEKILKEMEGKMFFLF